MGSGRLTNCTGAGAAATAFYADLPGEQPAAPEKRERKKTALQPDEGTKDVFAEQPRPAQTAPSGSLTGKSVHAALLRALRTTHKNAVLFTLCADLTCVQEGAKFVFSTENETVYRAITRQDNSAVFAEVLSGAGVTHFEVRLGKKQDGLKKAVEVLKSNFSGTDVEIK